MRVTAELSPTEATAVAGIADAARQHDGVAALSEQTLLRVRHGAQGSEVHFHLLFTGGEGDDAELSGFGFVERMPEEPDFAELVVTPEQRGAGHGTRLLASLAGDASERGLRVWAHGRTPQAVALARSAGWEQVRGLWKMRLRLRSTEEASAPTLPEPHLSNELASRLHIRTFEVGADEEEWLAVNARAFADHPEQGSLTLADLRQREEEDWFDPAGFFVAVERESGRIAGFHWTKVHADGAGLTEGEPVGEVYVVGVAPEWRGTGLGRTLTVTGVRYLAERGLPWVLLYVDEENRAAVRLYESLGFTLWDADVMYAMPDK
ncbi:mycothiol synthase [Salinactinospora qingdaonensis]|uniref:Mycothiol acetyltransferase n=1 Tax=Salinactinospora qingdaonensis TaxID=702744 RepID=A0ABP7F2T7_9ACTN